MSKLKAVLFDYGNVLCLPQERSDLSLMANCLSLDVDLLEPLYWQHRDEYDAGTTDGGQYWSKIGQKLNRQISPTQLSQLIEMDGNSWSRPNRVIAQWASTLKGHGYRTAIISNMPIELHRHIVDKCTWLPTFDHYTFSCEIKAIKPDAAIFQHCLDALNLKPQETVFLDDRESNVEGARRLGMHGIVFSTAAELATEIDKLGLPNVIFNNF
jgi:putative hydrolase of the HAD superfamily